MLSSRPTRSLGYSKCVFHSLVTRRVVRQVVENGRSTKSDNMADPLKVTISILSTNFYKCNLFSKSFVWGPVGTEGKLVCKQKTNKLQTNY
jgi:hypothetical protein